MLFLAYWSFVWVQSFRKHRDDISLIVLLFVAQGFIKETWSAGTVGMAIAGFDMRVVLVDVNLAVRIVVTIILAVISIKVGKLSDESEDKDNDRRPD